MMCVFDWRFFRLGVNLGEAFLVFYRMGDGVYQDLVPDADGGVLLGGLPRPAGEAHVGAEEDLAVEPARPGQRDEGLVALGRRLLVDAHHVAPAAGAEHPEVVASADADAGPVVLGIRGQSRGPRH